MEENYLDKTIKISKRDRIIVLLVTTFLSFVILRPYISDLNVWRGDTFMLVNDAKQGIRSYKKAVLVYQRNGEAWDGLGYFYLFQKKLNLAEEAYLKAIKYNPDEPMNYYFLSFIYYKQEKYRLAIKYAEKSIKRDSENLLPYNVLANSFERTGHYEEAIKSWKKIKKISPKSEGADSRIKELENKLSISEEVKEN